jgi:hypothetical protein
MVVFGSVRDFRFSQGVVAAMPAARINEVSMAICISRTVRCRLAVRLRSHPQPAQMNRPASGAQSGPGAHRTGKQREPKAGGESGNQSPRSPRSGGRRAAAQMSASRSCPNEHRGDRRGTPKLRQAALRAMDREASRSQAPGDLVGVVSGTPLDPCGGQGRRLGAAHGLINPKTLRPSASLRSLRWLSA